jgi:hypothetical protein
VTHQMPNPVTDSIRRFYVEPVETKPEGGRPFVSAYKVRDRTGFLPDSVLAVYKPENRRRPADDAIRAAHAAALKRRRDLNWCEAFGHLFDVVAERCATCGVRP